jgi:hypothetical protein
VSKLGLIRGLNSRLFIGCEGTYWIVLLLTIQGDDAGLQRDFLLWTACLADVDAATRASRTYTLAAGTCRDRKAEGA